MDVEDAILESGPVKILTALHNTDKKTQTDLHNELGITYSHVSKLCTDLQEQGFIKRQNTPGKSEPYTLTEKGSYWASRLSDLKN